MDFRYTIQKRKKMHIKSLYKIAALFFFISIISCNESASKNQNSTAAKQNAVTWSGLSEGLSNAESEKKPAVIFFYTEWCVYCKKMDSEVFADREVFQYMNENFISIRVNPEQNRETIEIMGEKISAAKLMSYTGARGFPTILFFDSKKKPVTTLPGFVEKKMFLNILKYLKSECYESGVKIDDFIKHPEKCSVKKG